MFRLRTNGPLLNVLVLSREQGNTIYILLYIPLFLTKTTKPIEGLVQWALSHGLSTLSGLPRQVYHCHSYCSMLCDPPPKTCHSLHNKHSQCSCWCSNTCILRPCLFNISRAILSCTWAVFSTYLGGGELHVGILPNNPYKSLVRNTQNPFIVLFISSFPTSGGPQTLNPKP